MIEALLSMNNSPILSNTDKTINQLMNFRVVNNFLRVQAVGTLLEKTEDLHQ